MTQSTSRGMFSGCGAGLISSTSGLESIMPVSTSTRPVGWSIVQTNTGHVSPSTMSSAARWALIAGIAASLPIDGASARSWFVESRNMQGGPVGELLDVAVERSTLDQLEVEVGGTLEDRIRSVLAGDHWEEGHLDAVHEPGGHQRPIHRQAPVRAQRH